MAWARPVVLRPHVVVHHDDRVRPSLRPRDEQGRVVDVGDRHRGHPLLDRGACEPVVGEDQVGPLLREHARHRLATVGMPHRGLVGEHRDTLEISDLPSVMPRAPPRHGLERPQQLHPRTRSCRPTSMYRCARPVGGPWPGSRSRPPEPRRPARRPRRSRRRARVPDHRHGAVPPPGWGVKPDARPTSCRTRSTDIAPARPVIPNCLSGSPSIRRSGVSPHVVHRMADLGAGDAAVEDRVTELRPQVRARLPSVVDVRELGGVPCGNVHRSTHRTGARRVRTLTRRPDGDRHRRGTRSAAPSRSRSRVPGPTSRSPRAPFRSWRPRPRTSARSDAARSSCRPT